MAIPYIRVTLHAIHMMNYAVVGHIHVGTCKICIGIKVSYVECGQTLKSRNIKLREVIYYEYRTSLVP
jgi:hypothetical protein